MKSQGRTGASRMPRGMPLLAAAVLSLVAGSVPSPAAPAAFEPRCARLVRAIRPLERVRRWQDLPAGEMRRRLVDDLRRETALAARDVLARLAAAGAENVRVLWGPSVVCAHADDGAWREVAALPTVEAVFADPPRGDAEIDDQGEGPNRGVPPEPPLVALRVPEVWDRGLTGRGVVVALIDTGVDFSHPDLADHLWVNEDEIPGNGIDDDGNGYVDDDRGWNFSSNDNDPSDLSGHGTKSAGLIAGDGSAGKQTGVAPDATLMVLRRGSTQSAMWEASQYAVDNGAAIISQSSSWKWSFSPDYASWRRQAEVELAAGVLHVNSAGNTGAALDAEPVPYNVAAPANCPPPWHHPEQTPQEGLASVLAVGNVDARSLSIAVTSAHGPSEWTDIKAHRDASYPFDMPPGYRDYPTWDGSPGLGKPDLVAPGDNSTTTALGGGYVSYGGTSAAAPRVAGIAALMLQAVPGASPAEVARALLETAVDKGPAGRDNRFGAGFPDALAATSALGPPLEVRVVEVIDPGPPRGDGDGAADEGEIDRLRVEVANTSSSTLTDVEVLLGAGSEVQVRDGYQWIGAIGPQATASTVAPHLSAEFGPGTCARRVRLEVEVREGGRRRIEAVFVPVGTETREDLIATEFEQAAGFTVSGTATAGAWVRQVPVGTLHGGTAANPGQDHSADPGTVAWVSGNGPTDPLAADVDAGRTVLTSPAVDASVHGELELVFHRWFYGADAGGEDRYLVEASADGTDWTLVEEITATENRWRRRRIVLSDLMTPSATTSVRFLVEDAGGEDVVEGGLDDLTLTGISLDCQPWSIAADPAPDAVGATVRLARAPGGHIEVSWDPPSAAGGRDPELGYRVQRSTAAQGPFSTVGRPVLESFTDVDAAAPTPALYFYRVESIQP
ncbi:MAG: S8 family serine peptidase [Acidobacteriota bacterium]|nr:S8 family serine peptidase [Acidobacteriota bacterium]